MGPHWPVRGPAAARERGCAVRRRQNVNVSNSGVSNSGFPLRPHYTHGGIGCQPRFRRLSKERGPLQSKARPPSAAPKRSCFQIGPTLAPLKAPKIAPAPAAISGRGGSILRFGFCGGATAYWRSAQWPWQWRRRRSLSSGRGRRSPSGAGGRKSFLLTRGAGHVILTVLIQLVQSAERRRSDECHGLCPVWRRAAGDFSDGCHPEGKVTAMGNTKRRDAV